MSVIGLGCPSDCCAGAITASLSSARMEPRDMTAHDELVGQELRNDPAFRAEWARTALARAVAVAIIGYRAEHALSQRELAGRLTMKQPQVARLELGDVNPSIDTLIRISARLGIEFTIDVRPAGTPARNVTKRAQAEDVLATAQIGAAELLVAAGRGVHTSTSRPRTTSDLS